MPIDKALALEVPKDVAVLMGETTVMSNWVYISTGVICPH